MTPLAPVPRITAGVTVHNAEATLLRALNSVAAQDWPDLEIVIVDDGSTDESPAIVQAFITDEPRARLIRHESALGYPAGLNEIVRAATGEFVAFFDDDDDSAPDRLRRQIKRLHAFESAHPNAMSFCYTNRAVVRPGQTKPDHITRAIGRRAPEPHGPAVADYVLWERQAETYVWGAFGSCTLMARKDSFTALGGFDEDFRRCAEWDFAVRAGLAGAFFIAVDAPLVTQYKTLSADKGGTRPLDYTLRLCAKHRTYLVGRGKWYLARVLAYRRFSYVRGQKWRSRLFMAVACCLSPRLFYDRMRFGPSPNPTDGV